MARSMDTWVSNNLDQIIRIVETGPKIAQKYIQNPCLFRKRKFDMRFVVFLKSIMPLDVYVYDEFYTRHSNNEFQMDESSFSVYETHFTVMNYKEGVKLTNIRYFDFEKEFDQEYQGITTFLAIKEKIHQAIKKLFIAFQVQHIKDFEALGQEVSSKCRGMYGIDVMITDEFEPKILEATFSPDCKRACVFNPNFFNEVFGCLFFNDAKNVTKL
jgi:tubulin--tyrosine ligase-like protein 12